MKLGYSHDPASPLSSTDSLNIVLTVIPSIGLRREIRESVFGATFRRPGNCRFLQALKVAYYAPGA